MIKRMSKKQYIDYFSWRYRRWTVEDFLLEFLKFHGEI